MWHQFDDMKTSWPSWVLSDVFVMYTMLYVTLHKCFISSHSSYKFTANAKQRLHSYFTHLIIHSVFDGALLRLAFDKVEYNNEKSEKKKQNDMCIFDILCMCVWHSQVSTHSLSYSLARWPGDMLHWCDNNNVTALWLYVYVEKDINSLYMLLVCVWKKFWPNISHHKLWNASSSPSSFSDWVGWFVFFHLFLPVSNQSCISSQFYASWSVTVN